MYLLTFINLIILIQFLVALAPQSPAENDAIQATVNRKYLTIEQERCLLNNTTGNLYQVGDH